MINLHKNRDWLKTLCDNSEHCSFNSDDDITESIIEVDWEV